MRGKVCLVALAGMIALGLFGCGGYDISSGFPTGMSVNLSGQYQVMSKSPEILPNFYSLQLTQSGKSLQGIDNLGRTWTGQMGDITIAGISAEQQQDQSAQQQAAQQQQQQPQQQSYHAEVYLTTGTPAGVISITGVLDTLIAVAITTGQTGQQQQQTTNVTTVISGTAIDETGQSGYVNLYNTVADQSGQTQTTTP